MYKMNENEIGKGFEHFPEDCLEYIDHPSHHKSGIHSLHDRLYVVTVVFNPLRLRSRMWNYWTFQNMVEKAGGILYTVEVAFADREFEITESGNPRHLQLRARDNAEIWLKENALNLLIERLPSDWKYVAWIDADGRALFDRDYPIEVDYRASVDLTRAAGWWDRTTGAIWPAGKRTATSISYTR